MKQTILFGAAIALCAVCLLAAERVFPLRTPTRRLWRRLLVNLTFAAIAFLIVSILVRPAAEWTLGWSATGSFGLVRWAPLPMWMQAVLAFALMDLTFYWWHGVNHHISALAFSQRPSYRSRPGSVDGFSLPFRGTCLLHRLPHSPGGVDRDLCLDLCDL